MHRETATGSLVYNFHRLIKMTDFVIETPLFPRAALEAYSRKNLGLPLESGDEAYFCPERGGAQGDYSAEMQSKIANVIDCLTRFPQSKRALITVAPNPLASHELDSDAKCVREVHFRLSPDNVLHASVFFRAHAVSIFPKNIHFLGTLMTTVARRLPSSPRVGDLFFVTSVLAGVREQ